MGNIIKTDIVKKEPKKKKRVTRESFTLKEALSTPSFENTQVGGIILTWWQKCRRNKIKSNSCFANGSGGKIAPQLESSPREGN